MASAQLRIKINEVTNEYKKIVLIDTSKAMDIFYDTLKPLKAQLNDVISNEFKEKQNNRKKYATAQNKELFNKALEIFNNSDKVVHSSYGKVEIGDFIDYLLITYDIQQKSNNDS